MNEAFYHLNEYLEIDYEVRDQIDDADLQVIRKGHEMWKGRLQRFSFAQKIVTARLGDNA